MILGHEVLNDLCRTTVGTYTLEESLNRINNSQKLLNHSYRNAFFVLSDYHLSDGLNATVKQIW